MKIINNKHQYLFLPICRNGFSIYFSAKYVFEEQEFPDAYTPPNFLIKIDKKLIKWASIIIKITNKIMELNLVLNNEKIIIIIMMMMTVMIFNG